MDFDAERFASRNKNGKNDNERSQLLCELGSIKEPCVVVDKHGRIVLWYIPSFLDSHSLVSEHLLAFKMVSNAHS